MELKNGSNWEIPSGERPRKQAFVGPGGGKKKTTEEGREGKAPSGGKVEMKKNLKVCAKKKDLGKSVG